MSLLSDLYQLSEARKEDLSKLPQETMTAIKGNIRKGAEDLEQKWANALELVHKAYEVEGVQRPTPDMDSAWKQYEENLEYAVQRLADARGTEADWRMSSSVFHEAIETPTSFKVRVIGKGVNDSYTVEAQSVSDIISLMENDEFDLNIREQTPTSATVTFSRWGIRRNLRIVVEQLS